MPSSALPPLDALQEVMASGSGGERAFVDGALRMHWARAAASEQRGRIGQMHEALRLEARRAHAPLRAEIATGRARGAELARRFSAVAAQEREHFVEEVLGVAYPPLDEPALERELIGYQPSGFDEITFAFEAVQLSAGQSFVDLGSGLGKAVLLADLLRGARARGIEQNALFCTAAERAASDLGCRGASFVRGDVRQVELGQADVVFMYLPFTGQVLRGVLERLLRPPATSARTPPRFLCCAALDESAYPELGRVGPARSWLHVYAWR